MVKEISIEIGWKISYYTFCQSEKNKGNGSWT